jgi:hypothetical protein
MGALSIFSLVVMRNPFLTSTPRASDDLQRDFQKELSYKRIAYQRNVSRLKVNYFPAVVDMSIATNLKDLPF